MRETTAPTTANTAGVKAQFYEDLVAQYATALADNAQLREKVSTLQDHADHLETALRNSRQIGTAIGILMAGQKITAARAFDLMKAASQATQRKIRAVALDVVETGMLEPVPEPGHRTHDRSSPMFRCDAAAG